MVRSEEHFYTRPSIFYGITIHYLKSDRSILVLGGQYHDYRLRAGGRPYLRGLRPEAGCRFLLYVPHLRGHLLLRPLTTQVHTCKSQAGSSQGNPDSIEINSRYLVAQVFEGLPLGPHDRQQVPAKGKDDGQGYRRQRERGDVDMGPRTNREVHVGRQRVRSGQDRL